jgi:hypothetical protein
MTTYDVVRWDPAGAPPAALVGTTAPAYELSRPVAVEEHADASVACAAAAASVAQLVELAHAQGYDDVVGVVVVEDLEAACDEDGGF